MKPSRVRHLVHHSSLSARAFAVAITALLASHSAHAAIQTWNNGAGNLTWDAASLNWGGAAWTNGNDAVFGATGAGAITMSGTSSVGDLTVSAAGYGFSGGILSLAKLTAANAWTINNDTAIASGVTANFSAGAIAGTLNKLGAGTLTLSGAVNATGFGTTGSGNWGITVSAGSLVLSGTSTFSNAGLFAGGGNATISGGTHDFTGTVNRIGMAMGGGKTVTVSGGTVNTVKILVGNGSSGIYTQTGGSVILPTTGVVELGTAGNTTDTSVFNLDGGTLQAVQLAPTATWKGTTTINLNGGTFKAVGASANLFSATGALSQAGSIFVKAGGAVIDPNGRNVTISSNLLTHATSTGGGLTKLGGGGTTLTLSGANTYTGLTTVTAGGLIIGSASTRSGTTILTGATGTGDVTLANGVTLGESASLWYVPTLTLQGNVTLAGNNRQQVGFKTLDLNGGTRTLFINPTSGNVKQTIAGNTALEGTGRSRWETLNDVGALTVQNGNLVLGTNLTSNDYAGFLFQKASSFAGNAGLTVSANVHLQTLEAGALGSTTANTAKLTVNGIWNLSASTATSADQSVYSLAGSGKIYTSMVATNANARTITLNGTAGSTDFSGQLSNGPGTGALSIAKTGASTQILSGTSSYTGTTTVSGGTLVVNGNISTSTLTTVDSGGTLGGAGTIGKTIVNGTLAPGTSPGTLTVTDTLGLNGSTMMEIDGMLGAGVTGGHDFVNLTGAGAAGVLTYGGALTLDMGVIFSTGSYTWTLFDMASETGTFATIGLTDQYSGSLLDANSDGVWGLTSGSDTWTFTESTGTLNLVVVPEPRAALLGGLGMLALLRRRRN